MTKPLVAVTMGDPAGVGPEVIVRAWGDASVHACCRPLVVGHPEILRRAARMVGSRLAIDDTASPAEAQPRPDVIPCLRTGSDEALDTPTGTVDARCGQAAYDAVALAASLALAGEVDAVTTAPLHKAALWQAGHHYPGHTELLAARCGTDDFAMMLYLGPDEVIRGPAGLGVVHVTLHMALRDVFGALSSEEVLRKIRLADGALRELKADAPRIAACALNPHAGESGLFGDEETTVIRPAVERAVGEGLLVSGPLPADTIMPQARDGAYDAVVAMYHDQGHIALKLLGMHRAVNVTLGLPIVRTSVAHGTAFDLAWRGEADSGSMVEALRVAALLATRRASRRLEMGAERRPVAASR